MKYEIISDGEMRALPTMEKPIRERLREFISGKGVGGYNISYLAYQVIKCPKTSIYVPIRELEDEGLLKFKRGCGTIQITLKEQSPAPVDADRFTRKDMIEFVEWTSKDFIRLEGKWVEYAPIEEHKRSSFTSSQLLNKYLTPKQQ